MTSSRRTLIFQWLTAALAFVPLLLFAYLGQFSRMMSDDYCQIARGQEMGAWGYMIYKLNTWAGSYANWLFKGAMAPLDTLLPRIMPTIIIILWLAGLSWLVFQGLAPLKIGAPRRPLAAAAAALAVAASINAFYSPQSFYWYAASTHYTLPLALLAMYMALALWVQTRLSIWAVIAGGLLCFISAGASEIFVVFQLTLLAFCLLMSFVLLRGSVRRSYALAFGVGWLATLIGLAIQLSSPGIYRRTDVDAEQLGQPIRAIPTLLSETLHLTFEAIGHPPAFAGFVMLMGVGLLVMLIQGKPQPLPKASKPVRLVLPALCLVFQLLWMPMLWGHASDNPQFFGRFSRGYMTVVTLNIAFSLSFLVLLWQRRRIQATLQKQERGLLFFCNALLLTALVLFALTQFRSVHYRAATYLFTSFLMFLGLFFWQLSSLVSTPLARRFGFLSFFACAIAVVCMAVMISAALFGRGFVTARILAPGAHLLVLSGLIWGAYAGYLIKSCSLLSQAGQTWLKLLKRGSLALVLIIGIGIALGQAARIPDFQRYAQEWDARHQAIIAGRDSGQKIIEAAPLTYDLADYAAVPTLAHDPTNRCAKLYYNVDSIAVTAG